MTTPKSPASPPPRGFARTLRRLLPRLGLSLLVLILIDQSLLHLLLRDDRLFSCPVAPFDPPVFCDSQRESLSRIRSLLAGGAMPRRMFRFDAELGWSNPPEWGRGELRHDWAGCRIGVGPLDREKAPGVRRILTIGCSMTHGEEVAAREAWPSRLDERCEDVEVGNLGVAGYGLDQALLRYRRDGLLLDADEVWLGLLPRAALRVTTLYRPLDSHWSMDVSFKPRFVLGEKEEAVLVENPAQSLEDVVRLLSSQEEWLAALGRNDPWLNRARWAYAPRGSCWAHHSFTGRVVLSLHEGLGRDLLDHYADRDGETYRLLRSIVRTADAEVRAQGARFRLVILPGQPDLEQRDTAGRGYWEELSEELERGGVEVFDLSEALETSGVPRGDLYMPNGHYSPEGSAVVARALAGLLER
jgi:hypothetical protein